jgi:adenylate cyclase
MATDAERDIHLEIGHVLFMDVVGYSKRLLDEQREVQEQLTQIVRNTEQVRAAESAGKLIRVPAGDGMALVFFNSPEAPVRCAIEISNKLKDRPDIQLRMGVHSGPVNVIRDVTDRANVAGAGINIAQRVMDCGDAGHILLSKRVAEDLAQSRKWRACLHDLGQCEVKHGIVISVVNLYTDQSGNPQPPQRFKGRKEKQASATPFLSAKPRKLSGLAAAAILGVTMISVALFLFFHRARPGESRRVASDAEAAAGNKSIAVLPFVNMSSDKDNAYFADGLSEEILNRLAQFNSLKVPGRTSSFAFKEQNHDLRQIGAALGVAHVLEGSVRKAGERLRITAQVVRTADGYHIWSHIYDRKLDDLFAIQEEIARAIAVALSVQLKLDGVDKSERPTRNMEAYDNYLEARALIAQRTPDKLQRAITLLETAVQRDPGFARGWAALAQARALTPYYLHADAKRSLEEAETAAREALTLDDALGAAHSALADVLRDRHDFLGAEAEYRRALELNPGEAETHNQYAQMLQKIGHTGPALEHINRAYELEPLSWVPPLMIALFHLSRRDFDHSREWIERSLKVSHEHEAFQIFVEMLDALSRGDRDLARRGLVAFKQMPLSSKWSRPANQKLFDAMDQALAHAGEPGALPPDLRKALEEARTLGEPDIGLLLAAVAIFLEQKEAALDALWVDFRSLGGIYASAIWTPVFQPLRNERRFLELLKAMKMPEYWQATGWSDFCRPKGENDFECTGL